MKIKTAFKCPICHSYNIEGDTESNELVCSYCGYKHDNCAERSWRQDREEDMCDFNGDDTPMINTVYSLQEKFKKIQMLFCTQEIDDFYNSLIALEQELKVGLYQVEGAEKATKNEKFKASCKGMADAYRGFLGGPQTAVNKEKVNV